MDTLKTVAESLGVLFTFAAAVGALAVGAFFGAQRQTRKGLASLVGDPPIEVKVPLAQRLEELFHRIEVQELRQNHQEGKLLEMSGDVRRIGDDLGRVEDGQQHHERRMSGVENRLVVVERRAMNIELALELQTNADTIGAAVNGGGGGA